MSRWRVPGLVALALLLAALVAAWWQHTYHRVPETTSLPPAGEAAYNPLYALRLALRADGIEAGSRQRLDLANTAPGRRDTVLLLGDPRALPGRDVDGLLDWVDAGGHLLVTTPRGSRLSAAREGDLQPSEETSFVSKQVVLRPVQDLPQHDALRIPESGVSS